LIAWTWAFFVLGLILTLALVYARVKSHGLLAKYSGLFLLISSGLSMIGTGIWFSSGSKTADICY